MAENPIPENIDELITLGEDAASGAHDLQLTIGLLQNTEDAIRDDLLPLTDAKAALDLLIGQITDVSRDLTVAKSNSRAFCMAARDHLKTSSASMPPVVGCRRVGPMIPSPFPPPPKSCNPWGKS
jgi:hypothetical protein